MRGALEHDDGPRGEEGWSTIDDALEIAESIVPGSRRTGHECGPGLGVERSIEGGVLRVRHVGGIRDEEVDRSVEDVGKWLPPRPEVELDGGTSALGVAFGEAQRFGGRVDCMHGDAADLGGECAGNGA